MARRQIPLPGHFISERKSQGWFVKALLTLIVAVGALCYSAGAHAGSECGADTAGATTLTCTGASYASGITYSNTDGLTLNLDNASLVAQAPGIVVSANSSNTRDIVINATSFTSITASSLDSGAINLSNSGTGNISVNVSGGTLTNHSGYSIDVTNTLSTNTGDISVTFNSTATESIVANSLGLGDTTITFNGGSLNHLGLYGFTAAVWAKNTSLTGTGSTTIFVNGGTITTSKSSYRSVLAQSLSWGGSTITMTDGSIVASGTSNFGLLASSSRTGSASDVLVEVDGGSVTMTGASSTAVQAQSSALDDVSVHVTGGTISATASSSNGVVATQTNSSSTTDATVSISGGTLTTSGSASNAITARTSGTGHASVSVSGGTVSGGSGTGAAIQTLSHSSNTITIGSGATIDGSASGLAIRDFIVGTDYGSSVTVTSSGTVTGDTYLGLGNDVFNLTGGDYDGDIYGDGSSSSSSDGNDTFNFSGGTWHSSFYGQNGTDTVTISSPTYDPAHHVLDGGDNVSSADGWSDQLTFSGLDVSGYGANITNWEIVTLDDTTFEITDGALTVGSDAGTGLYLTNGSVLDGDDGLTLTGNLTLASGTVLEGEGGGTGAFVITGDVVNNGEINLRDGKAGDSLSIGGDYSGSGVLSLDVSPSTNVADAVTISGALTGAAPTILVNVLGSAAGTGQNLILLTALAPIDGSAFHLSFAEVDGAYAYALEASGNSLYLVPSLSPDTAIYEAYPGILFALSSAPSLKDRAGVHCQSAHQNSPGRCSENEKNGTWARVTRSRSRSAFAGSTTGLASLFDQWRFAAGLDATVLETEAGRLVLGANGTLERAGGGVRSGFGDGSFRTEGRGGGITATLYGAGGAYIDAQLSFSRYDTRLSSDESGVLADHQRGLGEVASLETGVVVPVSATVHVTPQAQLDLTHVAFHAFEGPNRASVSLENGNRLHARLGLAVDVQDDLFPGTDFETDVHLYAIANLHRELLAGPDVEVSGVTLSGGHADMMVEAGLGGELTWNGAQSAARLEALASTEIADPGKTYCLSASASLQVRY